MLFIEQPLPLLIIIVVAMTLDRLLGEPARFHPLVGFGVVAEKLEQRLNDGERLRWKGGVALSLLLLGPLLLIMGLLNIEWLSLLLSLLLLYLALGGKSLEQHAQQVAVALQTGDLAEARVRTGFLVSRETAELDETKLASATVESVLENGNDAIFGTLFWFVLLGAPGAVFYRLANTLDAMWGYRNERYLHFGWASARLDDVLNYIPARLTALSYAAVGSFTRATECWRKQGLAWKSPNAGPVMAAGAGALSVQLGGAARYHGKEQQRPLLGEGRQANASDIGRAISLLQRAQGLWLAVIILGVGIA